MKLSFAGRSALVALMAACVAFPLAAATAKTDYIFRYASGIPAHVAQGPEEEVPENPDQYDVTARFFGVAGDPFDSEIPTKPGATVVSWKIEKGTLPQGLSLDAATGLISGIPLTAGEARLSVRGYAPGGEMGTYASVRIEVAEVGSHARKGDVYGHTGKPVVAHLPKPSSVTVYSWTAEKPLPDWVNTSGGTLVGTPSEAGSWPYALRGFDYAGREVAFAYGQIVIEDGPQVAFVPDQTRHRTESFMVQGKVARKIGDLRWEIEGAMPGTLAFNRDIGKLEGRIPTFGTSLSFRLKATDVDGTIGYSNPFTLTTLPAALAFDAVPDQHLVLNRESSFSFHLIDTTGPQSWELAQGSLPDGLDMNPTTGTISGVPKMTGTWPEIVIRMTDASGTVQSNPFSIKVVEDTLKASVSPVAVRVGEHFSSEAPVAEGGVAPYSFALADGASLPAGVTLDEQTGVLSGTVAETGEMAVMLSPVDSTGRIGMPFPAGLTGYGPLALSMESGYETVRLSQTNIVPNVPEYSAIPPESWTVSPASLPPGLGLNKSTGRISGTPTLTGTYGPYTLTISDRSGSSASSSPFTITVHDVPALAIGSGDVEIERVVSVERKAASVENAIGSVNWALHGSSNPLPPGLRFDPDGYFRGSITAVSPAEGIVIRATDSEGRVAVSPPFAIIPVDPKELVMDDIEMRWAAGVAFTSRMKPANPAGEWTASASGLPAWMSLDPATGIITGTAPSEGLHGPYSITATDEMGRSATARFTLDAAGPLTLSIDSPVVINRLGTASIGPDIANSVGTVAWSLTGKTPPGLEFDEANGRLVGAPTSEGSYTATFSAVDKTGRVAHATVTVKVDPRLPLSLAYDLPTLRVGSSEKLPISPVEPTNAAAPANFLVSKGALPPGLSLNSETGDIVGRPSQAGIFQGAEITVKDAENAIATSGPLSFRIEPFYQIGVASPVVRTMRAGRYGETDPVSVLNAVPPVAFTTATGAPFADPDGLGLESHSGSVSGVPLGMGERLYSLKVTDSMDRATQFTLQVNVVGDLAVAMSDVTANKHSSFSVGPTVSNAVGSTTYSINPAELPEGVSFNSSTGWVFGTPLEVGAFGPYTLTAQDSTGETASDTFNVAVIDRLPLEASFKSPSATALANHPFALTPSVKNHVGTVTWELAAGSLPAGMSLDSGSGRIEGTPTVLGTYEGIILAARDTEGAVAYTDPLTIKVQLDGQPIILSTTNLTWKEGYAFSTALPSVSNEIGDVYFRSPDAEALGLAVDPDTGVISGTFSTPGEYLIDLNVTDSTTRVTTEPIRINVMPRLRLTTKPVYATVSTPMTAIRPVTAEYAIGTLTYSLSGDLPAGLGFSPDGYLSGTPSELGMFEGLSVTVTDAFGDTAVSDHFTVEVLDNGQIPTILSMQSIPELRVGVAMTPRGPAVQNKKTGDVYSLNKPLPDGLSLDPATGIISGTPLPGSHGIFEGYVLSVEDTLGRGTSSAEFAIKIRHQDTVSIDMANVPFRNGAPVVAPEPAVTNPHALVGQSEFSISGLSGGMDVSVDPESGIIYGTISSAQNKSLTLTLTDEIGVAASKVVTFVRQAAALQFAALTQKAGTQVDQQASITPYAVDPEFTWASTAGVMPEGLSLDGNTGRITGTMPFGTYFLRVTATDTGDTLTRDAQWIGTSDRPLAESMVFAPVAEAEPGTTYLSDIVPVTGVLDNQDTIFNVGANFSSAQARTCYDKDCVHVRYDWTAFEGSQTRARNGQFIQMKGTAVAGSLQTTQVSLSAVGHGTLATWTLTSKEIQAKDASTVVPRTVTFDGTAPTADWQVLYDGENSIAISLNNVTKGVIYDFGEPVSFDSYYVWKNGTDTSSYTSHLAIETEAGWTNIHNTSYRGQMDIGTTYVARRIRLSTSTSSSFGVYEFRIGTGGPHKKPTLVDASLNLTSQPQTVVLAGSVHDSAYVTGNTATYEVTSGSLPPGASLSADGRLELPESTEDRSWSFSVTATDAIGFWSTKSYVVMPAAVPASTVLPVSASRGDTLPAVLLAYDGLTNQNFSSVTSHIPLVIEFDRFVSFDKIYMVTNDTVRIEADIGGVWQLLDGSISNNMMQLSSAVTTKKVRVSGTSIFLVYISEFRIGGGPVHFNPVLVTDVVDAEADEQNVQLVANVSPYSSGVAVFEVVDPSDLPPGATLSPSGMLYLPSSEDLPEETWTVAVRITDSLGSLTETSLLIRNAEEEVLFPDLTVTAGSMAITHPGWIQKKDYDYTGRWTYVEEIFPDVPVGQHVKFNIVNTDGAAEPYLYLCKNDQQPSDPNYVCYGTASDSDMWIRPGASRSAGRGNVIALRMTAPAAGTSKSLTLNAEYNGVTKTFIWTVTGK